MSSPSYDPALYALVHRGTPGDTRFYAEACRGAERVLELGCGYGRLIPTLVATGARYEGLDLNPDLLRLAKRVRRGLPERERARVTLHHADMRDFQLCARFDRVLIPYSALYCLPSDRDVLRCFRCVRAHLHEGGELLLDAYYADPFHAALAAAGAKRSPRELLMQVEAFGVQYRVFEQTSWSKTRQRMIVSYDYESARGSRRGSIVHRYVLRARLEALLKRAGFAEVRFSGGFEGGKLTRRSEQIVVRAC